MADAGKPLATKAEPEPVASSRRVPPPRTPRARRSVVLLLLLLLLIVQPEKVDQRERLAGWCGGSSLQRYAAQRRESTSSSCGIIRRGCRKGAGSVGGMSCLRSASSEVGQKTRL